MRAWLLGLLIGLIACPLYADIIYLKDGTKKEGVIVEETDAVVKLKIYFATGGSAVLPIPREKIERIEKKEYVKPEPKKTKEAKPKAKAKKESEEIPPPPPPKPIIGYRAATWGVSLSRVRQSGMKDRIRIPGYIRRLNPPEDILKRIPEGYVPPRDAGFSNVEFLRSGDYPEFKTVYLAFNDKVYLIWGREPLDLVGFVKPFKEWVEDRRRELGGETEMKEDGTMIWDHEEAYAEFKPVFLGEGKPSPSALLDYYTYTLYSKRLREAVLDWARQNLPPAE